MKSRNMTLDEILTYFKYMQKKNVRDSGEVISEAMRRILLSLRYMKKSFDVLNDIKNHPKD